ncbi:MAG: PIN domain-containing protein [Betaproteobacteria bacterium]|nr:MAG: PIN domain-containing protein [Betaproteobacteria bacterium]
MSFVLDCSVTMAWCFEDERTAATDALLERVIADGAIAPALWPVEVTNVLLSAVKRKHVQADALSAVAQRIAALPIAVDVASADIVWTNTLQVAQRYSLSSCDACYLELAQRKALPLATLDAALRKAASAAGVDLI